MRLFVGTLDGYKLDSKGRLSIPTKWRERLGKEFYMVAVTVRGCKCLTLYPVDHFEETYESMQIGTENQKYDATPLSLIMLRNQRLMHRVVLRLIKDLRLRLCLRMHQQLCSRVRVRLLKSGILKNTIKSTIHMTIHRVCMI